VEIYHLPASKKTPKVILDPEKGYFEFSGIAMPEDTVVFFDPLIKKVKAYLEACSVPVIFHFNVYYFNSLSSKMIYELFKEIERQFKSGKEITIEWTYEEDDESMEEAGKLFLESIEVPYKMIVSES
jgi:hypothetical protein